MNFGGRIKSLLKHWREISNDPCLIKKVIGVEIEFTDVPFQKQTISHHKLDEKDRELISAQITKFLEQAIVEHALASPDQILLTFSQT